MVYGSNRFMKKCRGIPMAWRGAACTACGHGRVACRLTSNDWPRVPHKYMVGGCTSYFPLWHI